MDREHFNYFESKQGKRFKSCLRICQDKRAFDVGWIEFEVNDPSWIENWFITDDSEELKKIHDALGKILRKEPLYSERDERISNTNF